MKHAFPVDLYAMQSEQRLHDEKSHVEILCLPLKQRITHMVLHFSKYAGRVLGGAATDEMFTRTLVDTFIISLASANALAINLSRTPEGAPSLAARQIGGPITDEHFGKKLAAITGRMAKACEAMDHLEKFDSRSALEAGIFDICQLCLEAAVSRSVELGQLTRSRWKMIEGRQALPVSTEF